MYDKQIAVIKDFRNYDRTFKLGVVLQKKTIMLKIVKVNLD